jgi:hypothetical protein
MFVECFKNFQCSGFIQKVYLVYTWITNADRDPELNLRNANDFYLPQPRTETFKKSTYYALPATWNSLTPFIKLQPNKITFKWALKAHLLDELPD